MPGLRWWSRPEEPVERCNATELMLRSGRVDTSTARTSYDGDGPVEDGLVMLGKRLEVALVSLAPYRSSDEERLSLAYRCVHNGMGDLAAVLLRFIEPAGPARPGRRRRPWGARS